jgi:hypothetical protein
MDEFLKVASVFLACVFFFVKLGMPSAMIVFKYNFIKVMAVSCAGGITGNVVFTYLSASLLKWLHAYKLKRDKNHKTKIFSKGTRRIIKIKNRFGLAGIAAITPLISQPIGVFFAEKFYKDKKKVILYLSVSVVIWAVLIYCIIFSFHETFVKWGVL